MDSHTLLHVKSLVGQVKQFFELCLVGVLSEEYWDDEIVNLHQFLVELEDWLSKDKSKKLSNWKTKVNQLSKYSEFFKNIVDKSKSNTLKQQTNKKLGGIRVIDMDCVDICLFLKSLNSTTSDEELIFKTKIIWIRK